MVSDELSGMKKIMGDSKFSRLDQQNPWKKTEPAPVKKEKSIRLTVDLTDSSLRGKYIFSYEDLVKKAKAKAAKESKNGAPGLPNLMSGDSEEELKKIASNYEEKYGRETDKRRYRTYTDLGAGYDSEDSFIDNTEANEEGIPEEMDTKKGGFYINTGKLEFSKRWSADLGTYSILAEIYVLSLKPSIVLNIVNLWWTVLPKDMFLYQACTRTLAQVPGVTN